MNAAVQGVSRIVSSGRTHVGRVRESNEDSLLVRDETGLVAVADGMGGHAAGEVASRLAVEAVARFADRVSERAASLGCDPLATVMLEETKTIFEDAFKLCEEGNGSMALMHTPLLACSPCHLRSPRPVLPPQTA